MLYLRNKIREPLGLSYYLIVQIIHWGVKRKRGLNILKNNMIGFIASYYSVIPSSKITGKERLHKQPQLFEGIFNMKRVTNIAN